MSAPNTILTSQAPLAATTLVSTTWSAFYDRYGLALYIHPKKVKFTMDSAATVGVGGQEVQGQNIHAGESIYDL